MALTVIINYDIGDAVYELTTDCGIKKGTIIYSTSITKSLTLTDVIYQIKREDDTLHLANQTNVFASLNLAIAAYQATLI
jgi:phenylacetate-coenzyme A ligase PaaK-like adenylate-forming protein